MAKTRSTMVERRRQCAASSQTACGRLCDGVVLRLAIVVGGAPLGGDPATLLQAHKRGVNGPLVEQDLVAADLLNAARDAVAMLRADGGEGFEDHDVEGSLEQIEF